MLRWAVVLLACLLACTEIAETATLVHIKTGQYISANGMLPPSTDVFSSTVAGERPWVNLSWLFDVACAGVYSVTGAAGLSLIKAMLAGLTFFFVVNTSRSGISSWFGSVIAAMLLLVSFEQFTTRPEVLTLLGVALVVWLLNRWAEDTANRSLWALVPIILVWSNFDSRMFLGLAVVLFYAMGQSVGRMLSRNGQLDAYAGKHLWMVFAACLVAAMINPFGWHALASPGALYGVEYPAFRAYIGPVIDAARVPHDSVQYFPMVSAVVWQSLSHQTVAGLLLLLAALVTISLNWDNVDWGHVFVFVGMAGFAMAGRRELAVASVVFCGIAALNAQSWYRLRFRQTYSIETRELIFSRGGRAATVMTFFVIAYLSLSGRISGPTHRRTGLGFHSALRANMDGFSEDLKGSYDDRPFNLLAEQGDLLIWVDQHPFIDSRLAIYSSPSFEDIIALHDETRRALRRPNVRADEDRPKKDVLSEYNQKRDANQALWKKTFDRFQITHVIPRLSGVNPDYFTYLDLLQRDADGHANWQQTHLGAVTSTFYRTDLDDVELKKYLDEHKINLIDAAFRRDVPEEELTVRIPVWAHGKSVYDKYLSLPEAETPNSIQKSRHYVWYLTASQSRASQFRISAAVSASIAHLAIRSLNEGLAENPQSAVGHRLLGLTYETLLSVEATISREQGGAYDPKRRFYQAVQAYNQAITIEPGDLDTHLRFALFLFGQGRRELAMREFEAVDDLVERSGMGDERAGQIRQQVAGLMGQLSQEISAVSQRFQQMQLQNVNQFTVAQFAFNNGCTLQAREILEDDDEFLTRSYAGQLLHSLLLIQIGEMEAAQDQLGRLQAASQVTKSKQWRAPTAMNWLGIGNYEQSASLWREEADDIQQRRVETVMPSLPLIGTNLRWPIGHTVAAVNATRTLPRLQAEHLFDVAMCHLETARNKDATNALREAIEVEPATGLRPLIRFYLRQLTGELIDAAPPSDRIPVNSRMFADET